MVKAQTYFSRQLLLSISSIEYQLGEFQDRCTRGTKSRKRFLRKILYTRKANSSTLNFNTLKVGTSEFYYLQVVNRSTTKYPSGSLWRHSPSNEKKRQRDDSDSINGNFYRNGGPSWDRVNIEMDACIVRRFSDEWHRAPRYISHSLTIRGRLSTFLPHIPNG